MVRKNTKKEKETLTCISCTQEKEKSNNFYNTKNQLYVNIGKLPVCKTCLKSMINYDDMESIYSILRQFDIMFDITHWESAEESKTDTFGRYITMANSLPNFEGKGWKDSVFKKEETKTNTSVQNETNTNPQSTHVTYKVKFNVTDEIMDKWGSGYTVEEYQNFEKKYDKLIRNYGEKTALHTEGLLTYIRYRVKEEMSTAKGDVKEAKEWGQLASKAATDAKINVSQLSKSDISGGVDVLSQLFEAVETEIGIIPLLPKVLEQPYDDADLIIWAIINYYRRLEDKSKVAYKDIYNFYDEMLGEYFNSQGYGEQEIDEFKAKRNNVFRDLEEVYKEPLYEGDE